MLLGNRFRIVKNLRILIRNVDIHVLAKNAGFPLDEQDGQEVLSAKDKRRASRSPEIIEDTSGDEVIVRGKGGRKPVKKPQGERQGRGSGRAGKKPEGVGLVKGTWLTAAEKAAAAAASKPRKVRSDQGIKRGNKKARMDGDEEQMDAKDSMAQAAEAVKPESGVKTEREAKREAQAGPSRRKDSWGVTPPIYSSVQVWSLCNLCSQLGNHAHRHDAGMPRYTHDATLRKHLIAHSINMVCGRRSWATLVTNATA